MFCCCCYRSRVNPGQNMDNDNNFVGSILPVFFNDGSPMMGPIFSIMPSQGLKPNLCSTIPQVWNG